MRCEADAEGMKNVIRAGISPNGIPEMFQILINERQSNPSAVEGWFATHPLEEDRIASHAADDRQYEPGHPPLARRPIRGTTSRSRRA